MVVSVDEEHPGPRHVYIDLPWPTPASTGKREEMVPLIATRLRTVLVEAVRNPGHEGSVIFLRKWTWQVKDSRLC